MMACFLNNALGFSRSKKAVLCVLLFLKSALSAEVFALKMPPYVINCIHNFIGLAAHASLAAGIYDRWLLLKKGWIAQLYLLNECSLAGASGLQPIPESNNCVLRRNKLS